VIFLESERLTFSEADYPKVLITRDNPIFMRKKPEYGLGRCRYQDRNEVANTPTGTQTACGGVLHSLMVSRLLDQVDLAPIGLIG
jgi:hypothetical protein